MGHATSHMSQPYLLNVMVLKLMSFLSCTDIKSCNEPTTNGLLNTLFWFFQVDFSSIIDYSKQIIKDNNFEEGMKYGRNEETTCSQKCAIVLVGSMSRLTLAFITSLNVPANIHPACYVTDF